MGRDLSVIRKLEKIEKEMGYCEIKLEKEQRLTAQLQFLRYHRQALVEAVARIRSASAGFEGAGNRLGGMTLLEVFHEVSSDTESDEAERLQGVFRAAGLCTLLEEELQSIDQEIEDIETKLSTFEVFRVKKRGLEVERESAMTTFNLDGTEPILSISAEFEKIEQTWNVLTEDLMNIDEAIFFVARSSDYLASARGFILASRSQFAIESWLRDGYLIDLFKHSTIGRAKEMVEGAERNLKRALRELICVSDVEVNPEDFEHLLVPFLDVLFDDLFLLGKLQESMRFVERRIGRAARLQADLEKERERILEAQTEQEGTRGRLFLRIGDERRKLSLTLHG
ncbi:MAG: hypothetical protein ACE5GW_06890 [Planctomycetota bacterium]